MGLTCYSFLSGQSLSLSPCDQKNVSNAGEASHQKLSFLVASFVHSSFSHPWPVVTTRTNIVCMNHSTDFVLNFPPHKGPSSSPILLLTKKLVSPPPSTFAHLCLCPPPVAPHNTSLPPTCYYQYSLQNHHPSSQCSQLLTLSQT